MTTFCDSIMSTAMTPENMWNLVKAHLHYILHYVTFLHIFYIYITLNKIYNLLKIQYLYWLCNSYDYRSAFYRVEEGSI